MLAVWFGAVLILKAQSSRFNTNRKHERYYRGLLVENKFVIAASVIKSFEFKEGILCTTDFILFFYRMRKRKPWTDTGFCVCVWKCALSLVLGYIKKCSEMGNLVVNSSCKNTSFFYLKSIATENRTCLLFLVDGLWHRELTVLNGLFSNREVCWKLFFLDT